ncbi:Psp operon transcriptional activator [Klebsiella pneumoniae]|nr:Psp operon transcriptional activator [Klebsiella pneumoniae]
MSCPRYRWICAISSSSRKRLLQRSLEQAKYHQKQAAELLGLTYHQLRALLKKHQL